MNLKVKDKFSGSASMPVPCLERIGRYFSDCPGDNRLPIYRDKISEAKKMI